MQATRFILAGNFVDGCGAGMRRNQLLVVKGGVIDDIRSSEGFTPQEKDIVEDLSHCVLLPALVDCSVSLTSSPSVDSKTRLQVQAADGTKRKKIVLQHMNDCHVHGVLGVADSGDVNEILTLPQDALSKQSSLGIRTIGPMFCSWLDYASCDTTKIDFIKVGYSTNIEEKNGQISSLNFADLCRIIQSKGEKKVVVVANGQKQVEMALSAGCDAIEQGYEMGENNLIKMAERNVLWIPNVLRAKNALESSGSGGDVCCRFSQRYVAPGKAVPGAEAFWQKMLHDQLMQLRFAKENGVTTALGTGAGGIGLLHGESMVEEIKLFMKAGYSFEETISCASKIGAQFFGMKELGALTVGRRATFLISRGSVKQLPRKLAYLEGVYIDGIPSPIYRKNPLRIA